MSDGHTIIYLQDWVYSHSEMVNNNRACDEIGWVCVCDVADEVPVSSCCQC